MLLCRRSGVIVFAYIVSTLLVIFWLIFTIQITLQENKEAADGVADPGRTSELIRVSTAVACSLSSHFQAPYMPVSNGSKLRHSLSPIMFCQLL